MLLVILFLKQKAAYELRISDWSSDVCSSDLRLTFDLQKEIATRMRFAEREGKSAVERFMQYYFLNAKMVGDVTGVFLAHLDDAFAARGRRFLPSITRRPKKLNGFKLRSEEHTSELQSLMRISYAVFCLKKKQQK